MSIGLVVSLKASQAQLRQTNRQTSSTLKALFTLRVTGLNITRHRAVSSRQHGFLVWLHTAVNKAGCFSVSQYRCTLKWTNSTCIYPVKNQSPKVKTF